MSLNFPPAVILASFKILKEAENKTKTKIKKNNTRSEIQVDQEISSQRKLYRLMTPPQKEKKIVITPPSPIIKTINNRKKVRTYPKTGDNLEEKENHVDQ